MVISLLKMLFGYRLMRRLSYIIKWIKQGTAQNILISGLILGILGSTGITFLGMLDSVLDFRKVRSYKST